MDGATHNPPPTEGEPAAGTGLSDTGIEPCGTNDGGIEAAQRPCGDGFRTKIKLIGFNAKRPILTQKLRDATGDALRCGDRRIGGQIIEYDYPQLGEEV